MGAGYQFNRFVVGAEGDWQGANLIGNSQAPSSFGLAAGTFPGGAFTISTTIKDYGSIRGRLGVAFDRFVIFGTAGWAWGNPSNAYALYGAPPFFTRSGYSFGWTVGAGIEYAFTNNVFGRIEYRYTNLGTSSFVSPLTIRLTAGVEYRLAMSAPASLTSLTPARCSPITEGPGAHLGRAHDTLQLSRIGLFTGQSCDRGQGNITVKEAVGDGRQVL